MYGECNLLAEKAMLKLLIECSLSFGLKLYFQDYISMAFMHVLQSED